MGTYGRATQCAHLDPYVPQTEGLQIGDHRTRTSCGVVERPDHHCGDDLVCSYIQLTFEFKTMHSDLNILYNFAAILATETIGEIGVSKAGASLQLLTGILVMLIIVQAIGNHEYDNGIEGLAPFIRNVSFPVLSCNVDASLEPLLDGLIKRSTVVNVAGHSVGIIGYTTRETPALSNSSKLKQESPVNGGVVRNATALIPERLRQ